MSVAAIPAVIEDKLVYDREQQNGSYSISPYVVANTLTSLPFILLIALIFTTIAYPLIGLPSNFGVVCKFILMLFLALYTVESIVIIISAAFPIFVVALALVAFINGFFMVVQGYFVTLESLPDFWIWAHYWSYQTYAFEGMVSNHFNSIDVFQCATTGDSCFCSIPSSLPPGSCEFTGKDVLRAYDYEDIDYWAWFGVLVGQIAIYRFLFWAILRFKTRKQN